MKCFVLDSKELVLPKVSESLALVRVQIENGPVDLSQKCCIVGGEMRDLGDAGVIVISANIPKGVKALDPAKVILIGARDLCVDDIHWIRQGVKYYPLNTLVQEGVAHMAFTIMEAARMHPSVQVYVDTNVVDGSVGGMTSRELLFILHKLKILRHVRVLHCVGNSRKLIAKMVVEFY